MHVHFLIGVLLLFAPLFVLFFGQYLPDCEYGFVQPLLNFLPYQHGLEIISMYICGLGWVILLWWIHKKYKDRRWYFKILQFVLVTFLVVCTFTLLLASMNSARSKELNNAELKSRVVSIRAVAETYSMENIKNGYSGFCSTNQFLSLGRPFMERKRNSEICIQRKDLFHCSDSQDAYVVSVMITERGGVGYFCADSTGFTGVIDSQATGTECR